MTWSPSQPRAPRAQPPLAPTPMQWAPDELALDTSSLHAAFVPSSDSDLPVEPATAAPDPLEMARALEDAFARGYEEGRRAGAQTEEARVRGAVDAANHALLALHAEGERYLGNVEANIAALAVAVARHIIGQEIAMDKTSLGEMVRQAVAEFPIDQPVVIRVNPNDQRIIMAAIAEASIGAPPRAETQWLPDPRIAAGGCLVDGRDRIVDGRVDTALERLYRRLTDTGA